MISMRTEGSSSALRMTGFATRLLAWHRKNGRFDLPWVQCPTPYHVWISEVMLQQTQVTAVIPYFARFVERFPSLPSLASGSEDEVLALWSGLGYYARARSLHRAAKIIMENYAGELPRDFTAWCQLPGIGRSTAGAIMSLAFNQPFSIMDGNVKRVLSRYYAIDSVLSETVTTRRLWRLAARNTPAHEAARYGQAIMDLGATVCVRKKPRCPLCPLRAGCRARQRGMEELLPRRRASRVLLEHRIIFLIITNRSGKFFLERRKPSGIWGGLWCFPEYAWQTSDLARRIFLDFGLQIVLIKEEEVLHHKLTHRNVRITPVRALFQGRSKTEEKSKKRTGMWVARSGLAGLGVPAPVSKLIEAREI